MYKAAAAAPPTEGATGTTEAHGEAKKDEGVIDAEYVDVDEKK
jgi:molecular chaperone DnaK